MSEKPKVEADLDPVGNRNTRPGAKIADEAIEDSKAPPKDKHHDAPTRPGSTAAEHAVDATRKKGGK